MPSEFSKSTTLKSGSSLPVSVASSWISQIFTIASGFILPRLVSDKIGQDALGIWDVAWSIVAQFKLVQAGFGSSVNRFVASFLVHRDLGGINRVVSSAHCVTSIMAFVVLILTLLCVIDPLDIMQHHFGQFGAGLRWLIGILGATAVVQIEASPLNGIVTGFQHWSAHNAINAIVAIATLIGSLISLQLGYGLIALATVHLAGEVIGRGAHWFLAYRICPGLSIRWNLVDLKTIKEMFTFGFKTFLVIGGDMLRLSLIGIIIAVHLGPAALAIFARPRALVSRVAIFLHKYAHVLVPKFSTLQAQGKHQEIRDLTIDAVRGSVALALPLLLLMMIMGGELLEIWMGAKYRNSALVAIIVFTYGCDTIYAPLYRILSALNRHGWPSVAGLGASIMAVGFTYASVTYFEGGLLEAAIWGGVPVLLWTTVILPVVACRRIGIPFVRFLREVWWKPVLCVAPYTLCLFWAHWYEQKAGSAVILGLVSGGPILCFCYWQYLIPMEWKSKVSHILLRKATPPLGD